jgi:hypothetical protein
VDSIYANKFVLVIPQYLERIDGAFAILEEELKKRLENHDWSVEVCNIALYFVLNGYDGLETFCVEELLQGIPLKVTNYFTSLLIAIMQGSLNRVILDGLLEYGKNQH